MPGTARPRGTHHHRTGGRLTTPHPDRLYTVAQAAVELDVPAARIRAWARAKKVLPTGYLRAPVPGGLLPLWSLEELRPLADVYHARRGGH